MSLEQAVLEKLRDLSPQQQKEVLDFAEFLQQKNFKPSLDSPKKLKYNLSDLLAQVTPDNLHSEIETGLAVGHEIG
ncbi:DUF2281 domain-containing protein [Candidatus Gracilibacteria bacterium]|jgi:hypothetical protein|nr:DUF2281 domain-containing protein [Candidatus Gracilibacteria bacterium]NJP21066.1 DUF2281 domain-containing protein [Hydrococcus sp. CRU_1_1]NJQ96582.1 DUF2281 domain-containing protein [Hydrococcus sp. CSU_1_8]